MYNFVLHFHSATRWLVILSLLFSIVIALRGKSRGTPYQKANHILTQVTVSLAHLQLILGFITVGYSSIAQYFWKNINTAILDLPTLFFGLLHPAFMTIAIVLLTIGSSLAKRTDDHLKKHSLILFWFGWACILILIAIPWPFSPLAARPWLRF